MMITITIAIAIAIAIAITITITMMRTMTIPVTVKVTVTTMGEMNDDTHTPNNNRYEWCLTDDYDSTNALHRKVKKQIEEGDGLPDMARTTEIDAAVTGAACTRNARRTGTGTHATRRHTCTPHPARARTHARTPANKHARALRE
jgi:hypothetical protein